jgi:integrase
VQFRIDGRMREETFTNQTAADQFGALVDRVGGLAAQQVLQARSNGVKTVPTLREYTEHYLDPESGLLTGVEPGTRAGYISAAKKSFLNILGEYPIDAITVKDVGKWVEWQERQPSARRQGENVAAKTVKNYHAILSSVMTSAVNEKIREDNPAYRTRVSRGTKRENVFLSPDEFATLLYFIPQKFEAMVLFMAGSGCRWGETTALTWGDLNLHAEPATVRIDKAWKKSGTGSPVLGPPKSPKSRRTIGLSTDVVHALGDPAHRAALIFPGHMGNHLWYGPFRSRAWEPAVDKASDVELCRELGLTPLGRRPTPHDLRHSHASWLIADGVPLPYIQARLGHEKITTTIDVYGHLVPDAHAQMSASIGRTLTGVRPLRVLTE